VGTASAVTAEVCAAAGVDWVLLDLEHGAGGEEQVGAVVIAAAAGRHQQGWTFVAVGSDSTLLAAALVTELAHARGPGRPLPAIGTGGQDGYRRGKQ
jgi:2-keto-3-deoxy-L-rhamnonate aldolase RhmA